MWIMTNKGFISVVRTPDCGADELLVRARRAGEIEAIFPPGSKWHGATLPAYRVQHSPRNDYRFRAKLPAHAVGMVLAEQVAAINYGNFKDSTKDHDLHDAYARIWSVMHRYQQEGTRATTLHSRPVVSRGSRLR